MVKPLLLPCPFCGKSDAFVERLDCSSSMVICQGMVDEYSACMARGPVGIQDDDGEEQPGYAAAARGWNLRAQQPAGGAVPDCGFAGGVKAASDHVKTLVSEYDERHGSTDPDTGTREYPGNGEEWVGQMLELIEDFTGIVAPSAAAQSADGVKSDE